MKVVVFAYSATLKTSLNNLQNHDKDSFKNFQQYLRLAMISGIAQVKSFSFFLLGYVVFFYLVTNNPTMQQVVIGYMVPATLLKQPGIKNIVYFCL